MAANKNSDVPELRDHVFTLEAGEVIAEGKSHYPDLVRLRIPKDRALALALDVLRRLEGHRPEEEYLFELAMFGKLEALAGD